MVLRERIELGAIFPELAEILGFSGPTGSLTVPDHCTKARPMCPRSGLAIGRRSAPPRAVFFCGKNLMAYLDRRGRSFPPAPGVTPPTFQQAAFLNDTADRDDGRIPTASQYMRPHRPMPAPLLGQPLFASGACSLRALRPASNVKRRAPRRRRPTSTQHSCGHGWLPLVVRRT